jgi:hypothetical protein
VSAKRLVEAMGGGRRAWKPTSGAHLLVMNTPGGVSTYCLVGGCDQRQLARDFIDLGVTPLDDAQPGQS